MRKQTQTQKQKQKQKPPPLGLPKNDTQRSAMVAHPHYKQPLIIHTFSPEIIQADAYDFMNLVQRLTGRTSHVSPPSKRPRYAMHSMLPPSPSISLELQKTASSSSSSYMPRASDLRNPTFKELRPSSLSEELQEEQQISVSELASRRGLSRRVRLGLKLQTDLSPHNRVEAGRHNRVWAKSPAGFEFSPSTLPTPPSFLHDFPSLSSPYAHAAGLLSPMVTRAGAIVRSPLRSPHGRAGAGMQGGVFAKSPAGFEFSPSTLPTPPAFLRDFPSLSSPYANVAGLLSPRVMRAGAIARSPMVMTSMLPSPGPLTPSFFADFPTLSPAAVSWNDEDTLSTELLLSPMSRGFGLPPRPSPGHGKSFV